MGPLTGIRIIDLSWIIAGPLAGRLLADFGAEVIKVESATRMDTGRANRVPLYGPLPGDANSDPDAGGYFFDANAGKRSCTLNLAHPDGQELLRRLAAVSDAVICNLGGDQLERWGAGYQRLRALNPSIVVVNMPTMESRGPRARWRGFGDMIGAAGGMKSVSGHPGDPPLPFGHQYPDFSANPFHAAIAMMAALHHREHTGEGQFIEVSQYESTTSLLGPTLLDYSVNGHVARPSGNRDPLAAPHNSYRCAGEEAWCAISIFTDDQWQALAGIDGLEALRRPEFTTVAGRQAHEDQIDGVIEAFTESWDRHELAAMLQSCGVPAGPWQHVGDMVERDPVLGDAYFVRMAHPSGREFLVHGSPLVMRRNPARVGPAPLLGEHTFAVLHNLLGLDAEQIGEHSASGAIE